MLYSIFIFLIIFFSFLLCSLVLLHILFIQFYNMDQFEREMMKGTTIKVEIPKKLNTIDEMEEHENSEQQEDSDDFFVII
jgi:cell division protein YceG involved in septum cleavage